MAPQRLHWQWDRDGKITGISVKIKSYYLILKIGLFKAAGTVRDGTGTVFGAGTIEEIQDLWRWPPDGRMYGARMAMDRRQYGNGRQHHRQEGVGMEHNGAGAIGCYMCGDPP